MKSKTYYIPADAERSGIDIEFSRRRGTISIGGWYDTIVGMEGVVLPLAEFFKEVGITKHDCLKAFGDTK